MMKPSELYQHKCTAGEFSHDPVQLKLLEGFDRHYTALINKPKSKSFFGRFRAHKNTSDTSSGVYLWGGVGRGKSMIMDLFYQSFEGGIRKERHHFHAFMIDMHDAVFAAREAGKADPLGYTAKQLIGRIDLLCFDEFFVKDIADAMLLSRLFTLLFDAGVFVVFTSNCVPEELYKDGIQRESFLPFINTINSRLDVTEIDAGQDYRALAEGKSIVSVSRESEAAKQITLEIKGRKLSIDSPQEGVAEIDFSYLCEGNLGSEDYLTLARNFHTIILKNVPYFEWDNRDAAMRFVKLVDILYDHGIRFVCAGVQSPQGLFHKSVSLMESERTVSRLQEMSRF